jgi:DNA-binding XRE family transcriptional regulator
MSSRSIVTLIVASWRASNAEEDEMTITPDGIKEARRLLNWSRPQLATRVGLSTEAIVLFENGDSQPSFFDASVIAGTLESVGVEFIAENGGGAGVRLRKASGR